MTLRLREPLQGDALRAIAGRIVDEARRHRAVRDALGPMAPGTSLRLEINSEPGGGKVLGPQEASSLLRRDGVALVASGFATRVLELVALIPLHEIRDSGRLLFVRGYAELNNDLYLAASGSLRAAKLRMSEFGPTDAKFLDLLLISAEHALGDLSADEFQKRCGEWREDAPEYLAVQYDLARLWSQRAQIGATQAEPFQRELAAVLRRMTALPDAPPALHQQARLLKLFLDAQAHTIALGAAWAYAREPAIWACVYSRSPEDELAAQRAKLDGWRKDLERLLADIRETGNAPLYCQALHARDLCEGFVFSQLQIAALHTGDAEPEVPERMFALVRETQAFARQCDQPEIELRSRLAESDLAAHAGDMTRARAIAGEVRDIARTLRYADAERVAEKALSSTMHDDVRREAAFVRERGPAAWLADTSDAELDAYALDSCETLGAPKELLPLFRDGAECQRAVGRLQRDWCRHLEMEDRWSSATGPNGPEWRASCTHLERYSLVHARDWNAVLGAFRGANCAGCAYREPWEPGSRTGEGPSGADS